MSRTSPLYQLIEDRLDGTTLADYVAANFPTKGWRAMARDLEDRTGVTVSYNTLRTWFGDRLVVETTVKVAPPPDPAEPPSFPDPVDRAGVRAA